MCIFCDNPPGWTTRGMMRAQIGLVVRGEGGRSDVCCVLDAPNKIYLNYTWEQYKGNCVGRQEVFSILDFKFLRRLSTLQKKSIICRNGNLMDLAVTMAHISCFLSPGPHSNSNWCPSHQYHIVNDAVVLLRCPTTILLPMASSCSHFLSA